LLAGIGVLLLVPSAFGQPKPLFPEQAPASPQPSISPGFQPEITVRQLDAPGAVGTGRSQDQAESDDWGSTPATVIEQLLAALPDDPADPNVRRLQVELLRTPTPAGQESERLLAIRLRRLVDLGEAEAAQALLAEAGPYAARSPGLAPEVARLDLASGQDVDGCAAASASPSAGLDEINLFCAIMAGDEDAALVLQNALRATDSLRDQPFGALVGAALRYGDADAIDWSAEVQPVDLALADHLSIKVPADAVATASLPAVARLSVDPDVAPAVRAAARVRLDDARGRFTTVGPEATRLRAIAAPEERARALVQLWRDLPDAGKRLADLPQLGPIAATITPRAALSEEAAVLAAILLAMGEEGAALLWFDMLEVQRRDDRRQADRLAVLMILAGLIDPTRMPPAPDGLFAADDAVWLTAGLAGQNLPLSAPWRTVLRPFPPPEPAAPAAMLARALVGLSSGDPPSFARGLAGLLAIDRAIEARAVARSSVIARLHG
jgi:hypothetical protein